MQRCTTLLLAATALAAAGAASSADVEVMTQNQYVGTDLIALVTEPDFNAAVVDALKNRAESRPAERAKALAALIANRKPALVGLQEVYGSPASSTRPLRTARAATTRRSPAPSPTSSPTRSRRWAMTMSRQPRSSISTCRTA